MKHGIVHKIGVCIIGMVGGLLATVIVVFLCTIWKASVKILKHYPARIVTDSPGLEISGKGATVSDCAFIGYETAIDFTGDKD